MSIIKGIKVGTTDITSTYVNGNSRSDTKELEVIAVSLQDIGYVESPDNAVYTGSPITPTPVVTANFDGNVVTLDYGIDYTLSYSNNVNVGTATVTVTGIGNYSGSISATWSITGATLTVNAPDQYYDYDGILHGVAVSASSVNNQAITIKYRTSSSGDYNITSVPQIRNVADSKTIYFKVSAPNHTDYIGSYEIEIIPLTAVLSWGTLSWTYDGNAHSTTCVVSNLVSGDTCDVILSGNSITGMGTTTVTATGLSNSNYSLPSDVTRTLTVTPGLFIKVYGSWIPVKKVFKRISGSWVEQEMQNAFSTSERYIKMN